jgi:hypothetical protein
LEGLVQVRRRRGERADDLVKIAVADGAGDAVIAGQCGDITVVAEPAQGEDGLPH